MDIDYFPQISRHHYIYLPHPCSRQGWIKWGNFANVVSMALCRVPWIPAPVSLTSEPCLLPLPLPWLTLIAEVARWRGGALQMKETLEAGSRLLCPVLLTGEQGCPRQGAETRADRWDYGEPPRQRAWSGIYHRRFWRTITHSSNFMKVMF